MKVPSTKPFFSEEDQEFILERYKDILSGVKDPVFAVKSQLDIFTYFYFIKSKPRVCPAQGKWGNNKKWENVMYNRGSFNRFNKKNKSIW